MPNRTSKTGSELFIVDNSDVDWKALRYLHDWCQLSQSIDIAIDPFAVEIARLRLWLSLAVDSDDPLPLPNLDFKIESGDSLTAPDPSGGRTPDLFRRQQIERFDELKSAYLKARKDEKKQALMKEIEDVRAELRGGSGREVSGFDWRVEFAEVFNRKEQDSSGFDIVLANPPYVRYQLVENKELLKKRFPSFYSGLADLFLYFMHEDLN